MNTHFSFNICLALNQRGAENRHARPARRRWGQKSFRSVDSWDDSDDKDAGVSISKKPTITSLRNSCRWETLIIRWNVVIRVSGNVKNNVIMQIFRVKEQQRIKTAKQQRTEPRWLQRHVSQAALPPPVQIYAWWEKHSNNNSNNN